HRPLLLPSPCQMIHGRWATIKDWLFDKRKPIAPVQHCPQILNVLLFVSALLTSLVQNNNFHHSLAQQSLSLLFASDCLANKQAFQYKALFALSVKFAQQITIQFALDFSFLE